MHKNGLVQKEVQQVDLIVPLNQEMMNISPKGMVAKEEGNLLDIK
jgi:hypothetical protein